MSARIWCAEPHQNRKWTVFGGASLKTLTGALTEIAQPRAFVDQRRATFLTELVLACAIC